MNLTIEPGGLLEHFDELNAAGSPLQAAGEKLLHQGHAVSARFKVISEAALALLGEVLEEPPAQLQQRGKHRQVPPLLQALRQPDKFLLRI